MTLTQGFLIFVYPALVGLALGVFYYGGLWLTLRKFSALRHPALWVTISLLIRTLVVVFVLYQLFARSWQQLLIALLGMLIARTVLVQRIKPGLRQSDQDSGATT